MKANRHSLVVALFMIALTALAAAQPRSIVTAPDFSLTTIDGKQLRLSDHKGEVILLDFWATWCAPCKTEIPRFVAFQNSYAKRGFQVIGLSMDDSPAPVRKFYAQLKMNYPVAVGTPKIAENYGGILGLPVTFLIGRDGRVIKKYGGEANLDEIEADLRRALEAAK